MFYSFVMTALEVNKSLNEMRAEHSNKKRPGLTASCRCAWKKSAGTQVAAKRPFLIGRLSRISAPTAREEALLRFLALVFFSCCHSTRQRTRIDYGFPRGLQPAYFLLALKPI